MTHPAPPPLAVALLRRALSEQDPLIGDLIESYGDRPSHVWFWWQTIAAVVLFAFRRPTEIRPLKLVERRLTPLRSLDDHPLRLIQSVNPLVLTASPIRGVGGLAIVLVVVLSSVVQPGLWALAATGLAAGVVAGVVRIKRGRRHDDHSHVLHIA